MKVLSVLMVTHGDALQAAAQAFLGQTASTVFKQHLHYYSTVLYFIEHLLIILKHGDTDGFCPEVIKKVLKWYRTLLCSVGDHDHESWALCSASCDFRVDCCSTTQYCSYA
jgi:hypothetical protein